MIIFCQETLNIIQSNTVPFSYKKNCFSFNVNYRGQTMGYKWDS